MDTNFENVDRNENELPAPPPYNKEKGEPPKKTGGSEVFNPAYFMTVLGVGKILLLLILDYGYYHSIVILNDLSVISIFISLFTLFSGISVAMIAVPIVLIVRYYNQRKQQGEKIKAWSRVIDIFFTLIASLLFAISLIPQYELILNGF